MAHENVCGDYQNVFCQMPQVDLIFHSNAVYILTRNNFVEFKNTKVSGSKCIAAA